MTDGKKKQLIIAFDIDDTIARFGHQLVAFAQVFDKQRSVHKKGFVDHYKYISQGMFGWSKEESDTFHEDAIGFVIPDLRPINNALQLIRLLKKDGHKIYFVSARTFDKLSTKAQTLTWLKEHDVPYDKLVLGKNVKGPTLKKLNVDIFIDDRADHCVSAEENGVFAIQKPAYRWNERFHRAIDSWEEVYDIIRKKAGTKLLIERYPIIFDTDMTNEIDDELALPYLLTFDKAKIEAITVALHYGIRIPDVDIEKDVERSFEKTKQLVSMCKPKLLKKIYRGQTQLLGYGKQETSEAVKKIIEICRKHEKVIFISIGAPVNLAYALTIAPDIADKIKLFSLMGVLMPNGIGPETNMSTNLVATRKVFKCIKDKTIFPICTGQNLVITKEDLQKRAKKSSLFKVLAKDFEATNKRFGGNIKYKSMFDVVVPFYLSRPVIFDQMKCHAKMNNTHIVFKGKDKATIIYQVDQNIVLQDFYERMKRYEDKDNRK